MTMSGPTQIDQTNLRQQVLAILRQNMIMGEIVPGEIYSAASIASRLGVSNSPAREAMLALVNQGLMEPVRNRGFRVVSLSDRELMNVFDLRMLLEVPAMRHLAASGKAVTKEKHFRDLADKTVRCSFTQDMVGYLEFDREFHIGLLDLLDNPLLSEIVDNLRARTRMFGLKDLSERGILTDTAEEHGQILDAVVAGDEELAGQLMVQHLEHNRVVVEQPTV